MNTAITANTNDTDVMHATAELLWQKAKKTEPSLGVYGFGNPQGGMLAEHMSDERKEFIHQIALCAYWLADVELTKTVRSHHGSYFYKHKVERRFGEYIPNGAFIAAAIGLGLRYHRTGVNAQFNIAKRCLTSKERRAAWPTDGNS